MILWFYAEVCEQDIFGWPRFIHNYQYVGQMHITIRQSMLLMKYLQPPHDFDN